MIFRYPGGKGKMSDTLVRTLGDFIKKNPGTQYREPFFGAGAIGWRLLKKPYVDNAWINDFDPGIYAIWRSVLQHCPELCKKIDRFKPTTNAFYRYKSYLQELSNDGIEEENEKFITTVGLRKIAIHQISYSGLGTKSGGPLGGIEQKSDYKIDCRWNPKHIKKEVIRLNDLAFRKSIRLTCGDFEPLLKNSNDCLIYLDPPYYVKGPELYQCSFDEKDHKRMSKLLKRSKGAWLLSYDDCEEIRDLYDFAAIKEVTLKYSINGSIDKSELLIAPKKYAEDLLGEKKDVDLAELCQ